MRLGIQAKYVREVIEKIGKDEASFSIDRWKDGEIREYLDFSKMRTDEIKEFDKLLKRLAEQPSTKQKYGAAYRKFTEFFTLLTGDVGGKAIKKLDMIPAAIKSYFKDSDRKWVFKETSDGLPNPYFLTRCWYKEAHYLRSGAYVPATTHLVITAWRQGKQTTSSFSWLAKNVGKAGKTVQQLLSQHGLHIETDAAVEAYYEEFHRCLELQEQVGLQMSSQGTAFLKAENRWYSPAAVAMIREGIATKVVIEDQDIRSDDDESETSIMDTFWDVVKVSKLRSRRPVSDDDDEVEVEEVDETDDDEKKRIELPIHPYLYVFDLDKHQYVDIHTKNLLDYKWNKTLGDKLIIKDEDKKLIDLLMNRTGQSVSDIVSGKMNGVIVLATGSPGIGKTLTAEVFSEMIEKPLYNVQCSQLGLNVDQIEKNLRNVLDRASRWGAILLVDEADVYIRKRGEDIHQNAIVGVFLRLIEYYRGVLFMTSNRGEEIDDAIISRATAWIKYEKPSPDLLARIWDVLGKQYGANFSDTDIKRLLKILPGISGRTVRNLLKLARMLAGDSPVTVDLIDQVKGYQQLDGDPLTEAAKK
jgi:hypothetical protein